MTRVGLSPAIACALLTAACGERSHQPKAGMLVEDDHKASIQVIGVSPVDFRCDQVAPLAEVARVLAQDVVPAAAAQPPPSGLAAPCVYRSKDPTLAAEWSFDLDCRESAASAGEALMVQYSGQPGAQPVRVGKSGIDAPDSALLFIDDDAPCYVRVLGPGADRRLALARLVADGLTRRTAPGKVTFAK